MFSCIALVLSLCGAVYAGLRTFHLIDFCYRYQHWIGSALFGIAASCATIAPAVQFGIISRTASGSCQVGVTFVSSGRLIDSRALFSPPDHLLSWTPDYAFGLAIVAAVFCVIAAILSALDPVNLDDD